MAALEQLNLRTDLGLRSPIVGTIEVGEVVEVLECVRHAEIRGGFTFGGRQPPAHNYIRVRVRRVCGSDSLKGVPSRQGWTTYVHNTKPLLELCDGDGAASAGAEAGSASEPSGPFGSKANPKLSWARKEQYADQIPCVQSRLALPFG
jgi:hypothetical protein